KIVQVVLATGVAPLGPALLLGAFFAWRAGGWPAAAFGAVLFYAMMTLFALPLLLALRLTRHSNASTCALTGVLAATVPIVALVVITSSATADAAPGYVDNSFATIFLQIALFAALGGATGAIFWAIVPSAIAEDRSPARSRASSR